MHYHLSIANCWLAGASRLAAVISRFWLHRVTYVILLGFALSPVQAQQRRSTASPDPDNGTYNLTFRLASGMTVLEIYPVVGARGENRLMVFPTTGSGDASPSAAQYNELKQGVLRHNQTVISSQVVTQAISGPVGYRIKLPAEAADCPTLSIRKTKCVLTITCQRTGKPVYRLNPCSESSCCKSPPEATGTSTRLLQDLGRQYKPAGQ